MTSVTTTNWMLYGTYGTTGRLILAEALRRGHRPVLAGRDEARLTALKAETGLEAVVVPLDNAVAMREVLGRVGIVLNAAGPFHATGRPLRRGCLDCGVSYIDINGEIQDFMDTLACDALARERGIAMIPGAGFGVVFGEALAAHVWARLPDAAWLRLSLAPANSLKSRGALRSTVSALAGGGYVIRHGELLNLPLASERWRLRAAVGSDPSIGFAAAPRAELVAVQRSTGMREIVVGIPLSRPAALLLRAVGTHLGRWLLRMTMAPSTGSRPKDRVVHADVRSRLWAEAGNATGSRVFSTLETGEGYRSSATAAVLAVERTLETHPIGALTPAQAFGANFALSAPSTRIDDLVLNTE